MQFKAALNAAASLVLLAGTTFLIAGSIDYWQGWLFIAVTVCGTLAAVPALRRDPALLERRMRGPLQEQRDPQKAIILLLMVFYAAPLVIAPLDHRLRWSAVPTPVEITGAVILLTGILLQAVVFSKNSFAASTIETFSEQRVVSNGPYAVVRHPLYTGILLMLAGASLVLGSYWGLAPLVPMLLLLTMRVADEEACLLDDLPEYAEYRKRVRWRFVPGVF